MQGLLTLYVKKIYKSKYKQVILCQMKEIRKNDEVQQGFFSTSK